MLRLVSANDLQSGFFNPNVRKTYRVAENVGMKLKDKGGIDTYVAVEKPDGTPKENRLPIHQRRRGMTPTLTAAGRWPVQEDTEQYDAMP